MEGINELFSSFVNGCILLYIIVYYYILNNKASK